MRSLNQIFDVLNDFATNHYQINSFQRGDVNEIGFNNNSYKNFNYPMMWVQDPSLSISGKDDVLTFDILFCDIEYPDNKTQQEILSDMLEVGRDLISYLYDINLTGGFEFTIDRTVNASPFLERFEDNLTGYTFTINLRQTFTYDRCQVPLDGATGTSESVVTIYDSDGVTVLTTVPCGGRYTVSATPCDDATVNVNGSLFNTVAAGATLNVPVQDDSSNAVGTIGGGIVTVADSTAVLKNTATTTISTTSINAEASVNITAPDATITVNDGAYGSAPSNTTYDVDVEYEDTTDVGTISGGRVVIPDNRYNSANPYKTGQTTSYASNDDGDLERGRGASFLVLDHNNPYGNTTRFLDELGGTTFTNNIVIDWATANYLGETVLGWYRTPQGGGGINWTNAMAATPFTQSGFSFYMPNTIELEVINSGQAGLNYAPFNITVNIWTSNTSAAASSIARVYQNSQLAVQSQLKTLTVLNSVAINYIGVRYFTFAELGL